MKKERISICYYGASLAYAYVNSIPGTRVVEEATLPRANSCILLFRDIAISNNGDIFACPCGPMCSNSKGGCIGNIMEDDLLTVFYKSEVLAQIRCDFIESKRSKLCNNCPDFGGNSITSIQKTE